MDDVVGTFGASISRFMPWTRWLELSQGVREGSSLRPCHRNDPLVFPLQGRCGDELYAMDVMGGTFGASISRFMPWTRWLELSQGVREGLSLRPCHRDDPFSSHFKFFVDDVVADMGWHAGGDLKMHGGGGLDVWRRV